MLKITSYFTGRHVLSTPLTALRSVLIWIETLLSRDVESGTLQVLSPTNE